MKELFKVIKEGLAVARFGFFQGDTAIEPGCDPIRFAAEEDNGGLNGDEFLTKPFRFLSKALTPYRFFDFTRDGVLEGSVPLFDGLTVYANHNADVNQWKGYTSKPVWDGENQPNGINGLMVIDRTVDANLARGIEIGALKSASVTIWFEYERSHPDLRNFYDYLGEEVDGEIVRFIVTKLSRAAEVSIVWEGEDPYAKALASLAQGKKPETNNQTQGGKEDMKFTKAFLTLLGITASAEEDIEAAAVETAVGKKLQTLETENASLKADAEIGKKHLDAMRERAATLYKALKGDGSKENYIENVIKKADLETAQALVEEYEAGIDKTVPLACPKCGEKLTRRSSMSAETEGKPGEKRVEDYKLA